MQAWSVKSSGMRIKSGALKAHSQKRCASIAARSQAIRRYSASASTSSWSGINTDRSLKRRQHHHSMHFMQTRCNRVDDRVDGLSKGQA